MSAGERGARARRLPAPLLRRLILCLLAGAIGGTAAWLLGMDAPHAAGFGVVVFGLASCLSTLGEPAALAWPVPPAPLRPGSRRDVSQLAWSLEARGGQASSQGVRRVRAVAARALALRGIPLDDPTAAGEVERLLGSATATLLRPGNSRIPRTSQLVAALASVERLSSAQDAPLPLSASAQADTSPRSSTAPEAEESRYAR